MMRKLWAIAALALEAGCLEAGQGDLTGKTAPYVRNTSPDMGNLIQRDGYLEGTGNDLVSADRQTLQFAITFSKAMDATPNLLSSGIAVCCDPGTNGPIALVQPAPQPGQLRETPETGDVLFTVITSPTADLSRNARYRLILKTVLRDVSGMPLSQEVQIPFLTRP